MAHGETKHRKDDVLEIFRNLCGSALGENRNLGITKEEASDLLNSLVKRDVLIEKLKKIEINREPYTVKYFSKIKKYFETMGHNGVIERICFDNSCRFAFSGGADGIIKCWSIPDGMLVKSLYGHENMISDLCINKEGDLLVSVDYRGLLNVWSLKDFKQLHSVNLNSEAIFCEFINHSTLSNANNMADLNTPINVGAHKIFIVLADGTVKSLEFNSKKIIEEKKNTFMEGESIKSICITDGGRLVICGGWWPFFLVYDTQDLNNVIVLEDFKIQTLCAAKNALKFAASNENQIFSYTFYCEGPANAGNFIKKRASHESGYWKKHVNLIDGDYVVEWLSFLPSFLLVAACSDNIIRIYEDDQLVLSFKGEVGTIYSHPTENIFVVVGTRLSIYQISIGKEHPETSSECDNIEQSKGIHYRCTSNDRPSYIVTNAKLEGISVNLIYSEDIFISLNDCQFSDDGRFLVTCDDQGIIRAYSIDEPIIVPEQQFFMSDLDRRAQTIDANQNNNQNTELIASNITSDSGTNDETVNFYRQRNTNWLRIPYILSSSMLKNRCIQIEDLAILSLDKLKLNENKFKRRYLTKLYENPIEEDPIEEINGNDESEESDDETYIMSESNTTEENISCKYSDEQISESIIVASEESSTLNVGPKRLRRSPVSSSTSSSMRRQRIKKLRGFRKTDASPNRRLIESESNSNANRNVRRTRRFIIEDSDKSDVGNDVTGNLNSSILDTVIVNINSNRVGGASNTVGNQRMLRRSLGLLPVNDHNDSHLNESMNEPRRVLRKDIGKRQCADIEAGELVDSSENANGKSNASMESSIGEESNNNRNFGDSVDGSRKKMKRLRKSESNDIYVRSTYDRSIFLLSDSTSEEGIDPDFETLLTSFSHDWLSVCSIYVQTQIYFNLRAYEEFMGLEPRMPYSKSYPRESGVYIVTSRQYKFIGRIPYLVLELDSAYSVKIYEYPHSRGIICTIDQYNIKKRECVLYCRSSEYLKGAISNVSEMTVTINKREVLKSMIALSYPSLNISSIPYSPSLKALFGLSRAHKFMQRPILNYSLINLKLSNNLYKNRGEFIEDLKYLSSLASKMEEPLKSQARAVYRRYAE
ncbi:uncharacterized protein VICG_02037 [Vittaforma corneae ATCC 50505]|uniref:Uncharacterized protein n=1 Tax=Vittaforma corneae (strain ATCC 50505) TaxID=993615 RepID=L2GJ93_VITCO|nr:uncharacterized protein VICG_02037 [Vittaforma corneae ATCC 50505]ELA40948.1 hypothetical protein VICG_02037 [Vittaforma corneae ATCC 50505]